MGVEFKDTGFELIKRKLKELKQLSLTLGFQGPKAAQLYEETEINVATVATFQELGTGAGVPARSFLRSAMFEYRDKIVRLYALAVQRMIREPKLTAQKTLERIGASVVKLIERKIETARGWAKPNKPSTIKRKGGDFPLHDTDLLSKSVTWAVRGRAGNILAIGSSNG